LVVPTPQVKFIKVPGFSQLVKKIIDVKDRIAILNGDLVKFPVVGAYSQ